VSYTISGTSIDSDGTHIAQKSLNSMTNNKIYINETGREMSLIDAINLFYSIGRLSRLELSKAIIWTVFIISALYRLGCYWLYLTFGALSRHMQLKLSMKHG
jgi:hypothetical protein